MKFVLAWCSLLLIAGGDADAAAKGNADAFAGLTCSSPIAEALKGRHLPDGPIEAIEAAHRDLGLQSVGGDELDGGSEVWWKACGSIFVVIADTHGVVRDALKLSSSADGTLAFAGTCQGGPQDAEVAATVEDKPGAADLPAKAAWKIDDAKNRFVAVPAEGMVCPRGDGVVDQWK